MSDAGDNAPAAAGAGSTRDGAGRRSSRRRGRMGDRTNPFDDDDDGAASGAASARSSQRSSRRSGQGQRRLGDESPEGGDDDGWWWYKDSRDDFRPRAPPDPPGFDGETKESPKKLRDYMRKVDAWWQIARNCIKEEEAGPRVFQKLEGKAFDYFEGVKADTFATKNGLEVLLEIISKKFDEKPIVKVGRAMDDFFSLTGIANGETLGDLATRLDRSVRRCKDVDLEIPDPFVCRVFLLKSALDQKAQATLLMAAGSDYNWGKLRESAETLYPRPLNRAADRHEGPRRQWGHGPRAAHETHWEPDQGWWTTQPPAAEPAPSPEQWTLDDQVHEYDGDPIPEDLGKELHTAYMTYRGARDRLSAAVKARGYWSKGSKPKGKGKDGKLVKGKTKKGGYGKSGYGKRSGKTLEEIKAHSTCNTCKGKGHWSGDPQCPGKADGSKPGPRAAHETNTDWTPDAQQDWSWDAPGEYDPQHEYDNWWEPDEYEEHEEKTVDHEAYMTDRVNSTAKRIMDGLEHKSEPRSSALASSASDRGPPEVHAVLAAFGLQPPTSSSATTTAAEALALQAFRRPPRDVMMVNRVEQEVARRAGAAAVGHPITKSDVGLIVWDTACQNSVNGIRNMNGLRELILKPAELDVMVADECEYFRFGPGDPNLSKLRYSIPCSIMGKALLIKTSCIDDREKAPLPFLAGRDLMSCLGVVIDTERRVCDIRALGLAGVPLLTSASGHFASRLDDWPENGFPERTGTPVHEHYSCITWQQPAVQHAKPAAEAHASSRTQQAKSKPKKTVRFEDQPAVDEDLSDDGSQHSDEGLGLDLPSRQQVSRPAFRTDLIGSVRTRFAGQAAADGPSRPGSRSALMARTGLSSPSCDGAPSGSMARTPITPSSTMDVPEALGSPGRHGASADDIGDGPAQPSRQQAGHTLPAQASEMRAPGGLAVQVRQRDGQVQGMSGVRCGLEASRGVGDAHQRRGSAGMDRAAAEAEAWCAEAEAEVRAGEGKGASKVPSFGVLGRAIRFLALGCAVLASGIQENPKAGAGAGTGGGAGGAGWGHGDPVVQHRLDGGVRGDLRDGGRGVGGPLGDSYRLKVGQRKRFQGMAREGVDKTAMERKVYTAKRDAGRWPRRPPSRIDLVEIFGGSCTLTMRCHCWDLRAMQPYDILFGQDLRRREQRRLCRQALRRCRPRLAVIGFPCTKWSQLQNLNFGGDSDALEYFREEDMPLLKFTEQVVMDQVERGDHGMVENPATSEAWNRDPMMRLRRRFWEDTTNMCMFNLVGKDGGLMYKTARWVATHPRLIEAISRRCDRSHDHEPVKGANSQRSGHYTEELADAILEALCDIIAEEDFGSSCHRPDMPKDVFYVKPVGSEEAWQPVMNGAMELLSRTGSSARFLTEGSELDSLVKKLVPWEVSSIQVAYLPKAKRTRPELGHDLHRCTAILYTDNTFVVESEYLPECQAPRERFVKPVKLAVFVVGKAPSDDTPESAEAQPDRRSKVNDVKAEVSHDEAGAGATQNKEDFGNGEIWFAGPNLKPEEKKVAPTVARMHANLGHPRTADFARFLNTAMASQVSIDLARRLRCAACLRTRAPAQARPARIPKFGSFNSRVGLDFFYVKDAEGNTHQLLSIIEYTGLLHVVYPCESRDSEKVWKLFSLLWLSWAGVPDEVLCDRDGAFAGAFTENLELAGCHVIKPPAEAHWQIGRIESQQKAWEFIAQRTIDRMHLVGASDANLLCVMVNNAKNSKVRQCGSSPFQWTFGKDPRVPDSILSQEGDLAVHSATAADQELRRRVQVRAEAERNCIEWDTNEALRKSILRMPRPFRGSYQPGEKVAYWREAKWKKGKRIPPRYVLATVIGPQGGNEDPTNSNIWVSGSHHAILVSKEQLRPAHGVELWAPDEQDMEELRHAAEVPHEEYYDERAQPPTEEQETEAAAANPEGIVLISHQQALDEENAEAPAAPAAAGAAGPRVEEPAAGDPELPAPVGAPTARTPLAADTAETELNEALADIFEDPTPAAHDAAERGADKRSAPEPPEGPVSENERATKVSRVGFVDALPAMMVEKFAHNPVNVHTVFLTQRLGRTAFEVTRKDIKQLEKEIPYEQIPYHDKAAYQEALDKEWNTWTRFGAVRVMSLSESRALRKTVPKERILPSRVCYKDRNAAKRHSQPNIEVDAKARIVVQGFKDPDLLRLRRDAPTLTRAGFLLICQICASFSWPLLGGDITGAFLQGDQSLASREEPLYVSVPREGVGNLHTEQLLLVVRGIFGLANSPRLWWRHLRDTLIKLGARQCTLDRAVFVFFATVDKVETLVCIVGVHVDDLLATCMRGIGEKIMATLRATFEFGKWFEDEITYCGKTVRRNSDGTVTVHQEVFSNNLQTAPVPRYRATTPEAELNHTERVEFRSGVGSLQWLCGQTRPDLSAATSLSQAKPTRIKNLLEVNRVLRDAKKSKDAALTFVPIDFRRAYLVCFSDSSWANVEQTSSQAGFLLWLADHDVMEQKGGTANLIDWRSHRIRRVCRSTLAAETMAMDAGMDSAAQLRCLIAEALIPNFTAAVHKEPPRDFIPSKGITDCRSLYDLLVKEGAPPATLERRLAIDIAALVALAEAYDAENPKETYYWVPTEHQMADHLTKIRPSHELRELIAMNWFSVRAPVSDAKKG